MAKSLVFLHLRLCPRSTARVQPARSRNPSGELSAARRKTRTVSEDLAILISHLEYPYKRIAALFASLFNSELGRRPAHGEVTLSSSGRESPKPLVVISVLFVFLLFDLYSFLLLCSLKQPLADSLQNIQFQKPEKQLLTSK
ncbi:hypothetical protein KSP40_PGU013314 [Platanthera guangdongensis]|uniref:Uncharacterized protein n=1 Tax=Platanthera guangdongensis TaxID=2320717 RepID=A0ABR2MXX1_9ASPA